MDKSSYQTIVYKGKGVKSECKNSRAISLLSIAGRVYAKILIERVRRITSAWEIEGGAEWIS